MTHKEDIIAEMHERIQDESTTGADWVSWYIELPSEQKQAVLGHLKQITEVFYKVGVAARDTGAAFEELVKQADRAGVVLEREVISR